jgi:sodium/bile acid cotransporter 7
VVTTTNMAIIFFIFGLTTDTSELLLALKAWKAIAFGLTSILVLSPLIGFLSMLLPFKPYEFSIGLAVMACVPTSLSSGVTLVIGAYGNGALALLFTVSLALSLLRACVALTSLVCRTFTARVLALSLPACWPCPAGVV